MTIDMFYPNNFPNIRRFHFGNDTTYDTRILSGKKNITFEINLCGGFKKAFINYTATEKYSIIASNEPKFMSKNNIEGGYVQILYFETGNYGVVEAVFRFKTKAYKDSTGKRIPSLKIEGRFRARGLYPADRKFTDYQN